MKTKCTLITIDSCIPFFAMFRWGCTQNWRGRCSCRGQGTCRSAQRTQGNSWIRGWCWWHTWGNQWTTRCWSQHEHQYNHSHKCNYQDQNHDEQNDLVSFVIPGLVCGLIFSRTYLVRHFLQNEWNDVSDKGKCGSIHGFLRCIDFEDRKAFDI